MSLIRKASKTTLRPTPEDFTAAMDHKNNIIASLSAELEAVRPNQEKYQRTQEQVRKARATYEALARDHETCLTNNQDRLELTNKNLAELRIQTLHLNEELVVRNRSLKEVKYSIQQLVALNNQKEQESTEITIRYQ